MSKNRREALNNAIESETRGAGSRSSNNVAAPRIQLKLDGKPLHLGSLLTTTDRLAIFIRALPKDELLSTQELSKKAGVAETSVRHAKETLADSHIELRGRTLWGSKEAVATLRERMANEGF